MHQAQSGFYLAAGQGPHWLWLVLWLPRISGFEKRESDMIGGAVGAVSAIFRIK